ncbi:DNA-binding transcriptional LysR family regulator [Sphingobium wenxiniae]|uniref:DNA-binding transcriptional LysR family regulator n=1 Tax=Sphingobium wenxiniae (strain DSM 21828 / CGMCC 1.7748 / JZ-1) TaxID=595605 RepID=A0A562KEJ7_SPHWJ|nr:MULTISPECIES: LysR family transcriptional regulator [Sphingobium]MBB6190940.1 DNA-binding transcriptional LysR family regulator [Sphingobium wenxiniae]TWH93754.1 DNA-binding transcriptional LysR family regulator [Sphingobium wenxiniae]WRD75650.1 LysR family transcriptional regulator [Sphingobium baderi]
MFTALTPASSSSPGAAGGLQLHQLRTLDALYQERSVTAAARRLFITPSAVSHNLRKLRATLGDELFRRGPHGMEPTERVDDLIPQIREALGILDHALSVRRFDPGDSDRRFRISCLLSLRMELAPMLAAAVEDAGSAISFDLRQIDDSFEADLESERADLAIATVDRPLPGLSSTLLRHEDVVFAVRADHPRGSGPLTIAELAHWRHVDIRATDFYRATARDRPVKETMEHAEIARSLAEHGLTPRIGIIVPDTLSALEVVKATDMIALCPRRVAETHGGPAIRLLAPPYRTSSTPMRLMWSVRRDRDEGLRWLRGLVEKAVGDSG